MSRYSKRRIEHILRKKGAARAPDPVAANWEDPPIPDGGGIRVPVAIAAAEAIKSGASPSEAWGIASKKGLSGDLPEVTEDGLDAIETELGYPAEETEELKRSYGLLDGSESGE